MNFFSHSDAKTERKLATRDIRVERLTSPILSLDVAPGSDLAVAAMSNGRVRAWHLDTGEILHEFGFTEPETDQRQKDEGEVEPIRVRFAPVLDSTKSQSELLPRRTAGCSS
jgi:WD40 repeat protein